MSRQIPTYEASTSYQTPPDYNLNSGIQSQINALKEFNQAGQSVIDTGLKQDAQSARQTLKYNISQSMEQFAQQAQQNPDAPQAAQQFQESAKSYATQLAGQTNAFNKGYVNNLSQYYTNTYSKPFIANALKQNIRVAHTQVAQQDQQNRVDLTTALQNHDYKAAASIYANMQQANQQAYIHGYIHQGAYDDSLKTDPVDYLGQVAISQLQEARNSPGGQQAEMQVYNQLTKNLSGVSYEQAQKIHAMINQSVAGDLVDSGVTKDSVAQMVKTENLRLQQYGGQPSAQLKSMYLMLNKHASSESYDASTQHALFLNSAQNFFNTATPEQQQHFMDSYKPSPTDSPEVQNKKFQDYTDLQKIQKQTQDNYNSDKMTVAANSLAVKDQAQANANAKATGTENPAPNSPFNPLTPSGVRAGVQWQIAHGSTLQPGHKNSVMPATNDFSTNFSTQFQAADSYGKLQLLNQTRETFGEYFPQFWSQASKQGGMPKGLSLAANVDPNDPNANLIIDALSMPAKELNDQMKSKDSSAKTEIDSKISTIFNSPTSFQHGLVTGLMGHTVLVNNFVPRDATKSDLYVLSLGAGQKNDLMPLMSGATKIAQSAYLNGQVDNATDAANYGANKVMSNFNFSQLDGHYLAVPKEYSNDVVLGYLEEQKKAAQNAPFVLTRNSLGGQLSPEQSQTQDRKNIALGHWQTAPDGNGAEWVDVNGHVRLDAKGNSFYVPYADAFQNKNQQQLYNQRRIADNAASLQAYKSHVAYATDALGLFDSTVAQARAQNEINELTKSNQQIANKGMKNAPSR